MGSALTTKRHQKDEFQRKEESLRYLKKAICDCDRARLEMLLLIKFYLLTQDVMKSLLELAVASKFWDGVTMLLTAGARPSAEAVLGAEQSQTWDIVKMMVVLGADVNHLYPFGNMIHYAARQGDCEGIEILHTLGADINSSTRVPSPLALSCRSNSLGCVTKLLELGADANLWGTGHIADEFRSPLHIAVENKNLDIVKMLTLHGADVNGGIKRLMKKHPQHKLSVQSFQTPLTLACQSNFVDCVIYLLNQGADHNLQCLRCSGDFTSPLYIAMEKKNIDIVQLLTSHGADINARCFFGKSSSGYIQSTHFHTALEIACKSNSLASALCILENGADVNIRDTESLKLPITVAVENKNMGMAHALVAYGANPDEGLLVFLSIMAHFYLSCHSSHHVSASYHEKYTPYRLENMLSLPLAVYCRSPLHVYVLMKMHNEAEIQGNNNKYSAISSMKQDNGEEYLPFLCWPDKADGHQVPYTPGQLSIVRGTLMSTRLLLAAGCDTTGMLSLIQRELLKPDKDVPICNKLIDKWQLDTRASPSYRGVLLNLQADLENVRSLMILARAAIRKTFRCTPKTAIRNLPLPSRLKNYLDLCDLPELLKAKEFKNLS